ncbi:MAG: hypothetical protein WCH11_02015 [Bdellovibrio sp.]
MWESTMLDLNSTLSSDHFEPTKAASPSIGNIGKVLINRVLSKLKMRKVNDSQPAPVDHGLRENLAPILSQTGRILEIGPFTNPICCFPNAKFFDVLDRENLVRRAKEQGLPTEQIPFIHFMNPVGDLAEIYERFDCIISSHSVEHQPDLVHHLQQVSNLLVANGFYFLVIPDKRFCFDHFLPESSIADILDSHFQRKKTFRME